jgi:hypothetical protein
MRIEIGDLIMTTCNTYIGLVEGFDLDMREVYIRWADDSDGMDWSCESPVSILILKEGNWHDAVALWK